MHTPRAKLHTVIEGNQFVQTEKRVLNAEETVNAATEILSHLKQINSPMMIERRLNEVLDVLIYKFGTASVPLPPEIVNTLLLRIKECREHLQNQQSDPKQVKADQQRREKFDD